ncbi:PAS domain-containing protein [Ferrimonas lipolytica]|uniref:histidine kinase n=2 Tax=Ferrimonas lipolytica TaxID=2724191 RepID=A0A6H1UIN2_9GAMM|nr:PAS domain-containing protein [Ferrimonas lipolytica]
MQLLPAGIVVLDSRGIVIEANPQAIELLGEPLIGTRWRELIKRAFAPQRDDGHEITLHNGRRVKLATRALDPEPGQLIMLTDLTETRQLQHNISHLERLSALGKMAASLAHQIRTPLSAALLYAANMGNRNLDERGRERFQTKLMARLGELEQRVNDLLLFARGGNQNNVNKPISLQQLVQLLQQSCEAQLLQKGATWLAPPQLPGKISANIETLNSALQNLVINALEAGATALQLQVEQCQHFVKIRILDNGSGMDDAVQQRILSPFYTTKPNGTGLGLSVVASVCSNHGGRLEVTSALGQGSCFTVVLPRFEQGTSR